MTSESHHATVGRLRPRLSIGVGMALIAFCALAFASLRSASEFWQAVTTSVTIIVLSASPLGIIYRRQGRRAFWVGFAIFGWMTWLLAFSNMLPTLPLFSRWAWVELFDWVHPTPAAQVTLSGGFMLIGQSLTCLLSGALGGILALAFHATRDRQTEQRSG